MLSLLIDLFVSFSSHLFQLLIIWKEGKRSQCARMHWRDQGVKWAGVWWELDGGWMAAKKHRVAACLPALCPAVALGPGEGTTTQMWRSEPGRPPCGNLPVFNVGERTGGGQVLPNGNIALPAPVKKSSNQDLNNLLQVAVKTFQILNEISS